jgi:dGTPase
MPDRDLIEAACFAHDLGHPPYGHGGERALYAEMRECGAFEGNAHTLRIISRLEKYQARGRGINPTRRLLLAILKYPVPYGMFDLTNHEVKPPKCYFEDERDVVAWALEGFSNEERDLLLEQNEKGRAKHRSFDSYLMELADDIAYGIHDIEDIVARKLADREHRSNQHLRLLADR